MNTREQFTPELWEYVENAVADGTAQIVENQSYKAHIRKGSDLIEQGVTEIYNNLEDAHEPVKADGYVITGAAGEQWCIKEKNLPKYGVTADEIPPEGMDVMTQPDGKIMIAIPTSKEMQGAVETDWASLKLNAPETQDGKPIPHGDGDYILIPTVFNKETKTVEIDRECGDARVVNGSIMDVLYQEIEPEVLKIPAIIEAIEQEQSALAQLQHLEKLGEQVNELKNGMDELGERIDKLGENLEEWKKQNEETAEKPLHIEITGGSADSPQVMKEDGTNGYYLNADNQAMKVLAERSPELLKNHQSEDYQDVKIHVTVDIYRENITDVSLQYQLEEYSVPMSDKELGLLTEAMQEIGADIHKDARESSEKWQNYGNADYLDKGGLQIRATHYGDNEENCRLDIVQLKEHPDAVAVGLGENSDVMLYSFQQINMQDIEHCRNVDGFMEQYGLNENSTVKEIAEALMKSTKEIKEIGYDEWNESLKSSSGEYISFQPVCSEIERTTNKLELAQILQDSGIDVSERLNELELEQKAGLHIEIIDKSIDNPQIMCENGESFLNYYIAADDRTLEELCERTCLFEESGLESFDELVNSDWHESYVDMYVNAYQDGSMNVCLTYGGSEYSVPMNTDELELLEYKMKKSGMDVQEDLKMYHDELSEIRSEKDSFVKD